MAVPKVAVGLPVHNGEAVLAPAIESILAQTHRDLELILSDDASTDGTQAICQDFIRRDERVRYFRQERRLGAAANRGFVFSQSSSAYFRWADAGDLLAPALLERCLAVLDADPSAVLCFTGVQFIDEDRTPLREDPGLAADDPVERFEAVVLRSAMLLPLFGVIRAASLAKADPERSFRGADRALLAELSLMGRIQQVPERLLFRRRHQPPAGIARARTTAALARAAMAAPVSARQRLRLLGNVARFAAGRPAPARQPVR